MITQIKSIVKINNKKMELPKDKVYSKKQVNKIKVYFRTSSKVSYLVDVPFLTSYDQLFSIIQPTVSKLLSLKSLILVYKGNRLISSDTSIELQQKSIIHLINYSQVQIQTINILVKLVNEGKKQRFKVHSNKKILNFVENEFKQTFNLEKQNILLIYTGKQLSLQKTFFQQLIEDDSEILCLNNPDQHYKQSKSEEKVQSSQEIINPINFLEINKNAVDELQSFPLQTFNSAPEFQNLEKVDKLENLLPYYKQQSNQQTSNLKQKSSNNTNDLKAKEQQNSQKLDKQEDKSKQTLTLISFDQTNLGISTQNLASKKKQLLKLDIHRNIQGCSQKIKSLAYKQLLQLYPKSCYPCPQHNSSFLYFHPLPEQYRPICKSCGGRLRGRSSYLTCPQSKYCHTLCSSCKICPLNHSLKQMCSLRHILKNKEKYFFFTPNFQQLYEQNKFVCESCKELRQCDETKKISMWRCNGCDWNICEKCIKQTDQIWLKMGQDDDSQDENL